MLHLYKKKNQSSLHITQKNMYNIIQWQTCIFRAKLLSTSASSAKLIKTCQAFDSWENTTLCSRISVEAGWIPVSSCWGIRGFGWRWKLVSNDTQKQRCVSPNNGDACDESSDYDQTETDGKKCTANSCCNNGDTGLAECQAYTGKKTESLINLITPYVYLLVAKLCQCFSIVS